ncbi:hypothetical protein ACHAXA_006476 [Cyclostephanos tholiformis]|uniref:Prokaryotic-type class I peptide chain release factors domain-containing protein n=1 Tax=Cyclostephanos tholiformis TaxID=382380 RepID=A0ABD3RZG0_9STRA
MKARHDVVMEMLRDGAGGGGGDRDHSTLGRELSSLSSISSACDGVRELHVERKSLMELLDETGGDYCRERTVDGVGDVVDDSDAGTLDMIEEIERELSILDGRSSILAGKIRDILVPTFDPTDVANLTTADAVIDIRAGTGGDEACLFAAEILASYEAIAKAGGGGGGGDDGYDLGGKSWEVEVLSVSRTDLGGVKEASLVVSSRGGGSGIIVEDDPSTTSGHVLQRLGPYGFFQYESGVHRVQRVPVNSPKLQTSAVSVAVLPSVDDSDISSALPESELRIDVMRASGAGGQHVNTTESAVRVTHLPTGIVACIQDERSQHKNKAKALKLVAARVHQRRKEQELRDRSGLRSSLMGGGDRSERIRTYNFAQDRITDHRCKVTIQGVQAWLGGGTMVRKFAPYLYEMEREERLVAMEGGDEVRGRKGSNTVVRGKKDTTAR